MQQFEINRKIILIDRKAEKEINKFPQKVQVELRACLSVLEKIGYLKKQMGKKIGFDLFEIRIACQGQFRSIYAYLAHPKIIILSAFQKKTNKTPIKEINKARQRLKKYLN
ncbi:MAG: hypothetical protein A2383_03100 [Candidatus Pacebacteria bacterium RIFOXYB1_FULL_39_46]|nr:MAG: hypothetical protein A2182_01145 [Candidatus Pacebacteria bacterium RIFOXYA1_FULL_38_18]OGJ38411.1 MAG: hypothetical protein A2383_03100 [Candidatus Pacebacteria bacterium RIFOXYB1_FULL_39_46]OGJ40272.1 MAG: hypothetical protein A2411_03245 [Candidatus Pacebacteria bacterium RIFOXYC1_FULL_39_21]OGJ40845.1 MAG: hypothetical protein A2582_01980 [Candidatus Pacebacteria bacterium RIFOXYD1_FULL_39_27]